MINDQMEDNGPDIQRCLATRLNVLSELAGLFRQRHYRFDIEITPVPLTDYLAHRDDLIEARTCLEAYKRLEDLTPEQLDLARDSLENVNRFLQNAEDRILGYQERHNTSK